MHGRRVGVNCLFTIRKENARKTGIVFVKLISGKTRIIVILIHDNQSANL